MGNGRGLARGSGGCGRGRSPYLASGATTDAPPAGLLGDAVWPVEGVGDGHHRHARGLGDIGRAIALELARGFALVWSGPGIRTFTATGDRPVQEHEPTLFEIWVCADGYWCDHTKNVCPGELDPRYDELLDRLLTVYRRAVEHVRPGASLAELDRLATGGDPGGDARSGADAA